MDLGDLFMLSNYHHIISGSINVDEIIQENLKKVIFPTNTISTKHIFRRVSDSLNPEIPSVIQFSQKSNNSKNVCKVFPAHKKVKTATPSDHPHFRQSTRQAIYISSTNLNTSCKREYEMTTSENSSCKSLKVETNDTMDHKSVEYAKIPRKERLNVELRNENIKIPSQGKILSSQDSKMITPNTYSRYQNLCDKRSGSIICGDQQQTPMLQNRTYQTAESSGKTYTEQDVQRMETIINTLVKAQKGYSEMPIDNQTPIQQNGSQALEKCKQLVGEKSEDTTPEGLQTLETLLHLMQHRIKQIVKFSKSISGFSELSVHDRLTLMKASKSESQMLGSVVVDSRTRSFQISKGKKTGFEELQQLFPREFLEHVFHISRRLESLDLSEREMAILRAMIVTFPEREGLEDQAAVKRIYTNLGKCLLYVIMQNGRHDISLRLCQVDDVLKFMRESTVMYNHVVVSVFEKGNVIENFDLIKEFMDM